MFVCQGLRVPASCWLKIQKNTSFHHLPGSTGHHLSGQFAYLQNVSPYLTKPPSLHQQISKKTTLNQPPNLDNQPSKHPLSLSGSRRCRFFTPLVASIAHVSERRLRGVSLLRRNISVATWHHGISQCTAASNDQRLDLQTEGWKKHLGLGK